MDFSLFYDIGTVVLILGFMYTGAKKGFLRTVILVVGYIVAIVISFVISNVISEPIYDKAFSKKIENIVYENYYTYDLKQQIKDIFKRTGSQVNITDSDVDKILESGGNYKQQLDELIDKKAQKNSQVLETQVDSVLSVANVLPNIKDKIPNGVYKYIQEILTESDEKFDEFITALINPSKEEGAKQIAEVAVKPVCVNLIEFVVFVIAFAITMIIIRFVANLFKKFYLIPIAGSINTFLGGVIGIGQGIIIIYLTGLVLSILISITNNSLLVFNDSTIEASKIFRLIYNFKIF